VTKVEMHALRIALALIDEPDHRLDVGNRRAMARLADMTAAEVSAASTWLATHGAIINGVTWRLAPRTGSGTVWSLLPDGDVDGDYTPQGIRLVIAQIKAAADQQADVRASFLRNLKHVVKSSERQLIYAMARARTDSERMELSTEWGHLRSWADRLKAVA